MAQLPIAATVSVPAFAVQISVGGDFPFPYEVTGFGASWLVNAIEVSNKLATGFTLTFDAGPPAGGGSIDYLVVQGI